VMGDDPVVVDDSTTETVTLSGVSYDVRVRSD